MSRNNPDDREVKSEAFEAIVEINVDGEGIFSDGVSPREAPPKAKVSRKPPGANLSKKS